MRRILLTGADGQVGWELRRTLACLGDVAAFARSTLDLADLDDVRRQVREVAPHIIVNAAAYTAVDRAESDETAASVVNAAAPGLMAEEAERLGAWMVHFSTDYVFDGSKHLPYREDDAPNPINVYGRTKLAGERAVTAASKRHLIFRTSWVYASRGKNFLRTMLRLGAERDELRVVDDQRGAPTWARLIAEAAALALVQVSRDGDIAGCAGTYHLTCAGAASWRDFAQTIFDASPAPRKPQVLPIASADYPTPAPRPMNSVLDNAKLAQTFGISLPEWRDALALCMSEMADKDSRLRA